eukprot:TRINITY_DN98_c0_g1_i1.p1 TRINITY_DN98_c0_g1~~TRINITY_DN98_c0_g1_i1.p1  ORF type:complete len:463 (-),score=136.46 TRINITY_DN98_c0_g1_i1:83-1348(-)
MSQPPYGYPPQGGYPPQQPGYPPQGYPPQQGGYPPQQPGYPPQGYPPQQPGYGAPPPQGYPPQGYPQQPGYGAPPPQGYPPQGYAQPGYPAPAPGYATAPVPAAYGAPVGVPVVGVAPGGPFDPRRDAETLRAAMKGIGTDEKTIIRILGSRNPNERLAIAQAFATIYKKDLDKALDSETSGNFCKLLKRLVRPVPEVKADYLHDAMVGAGTKDRWLMDVFTQSSNGEISAIRAYYNKAHNEDLEHRVKSETSGNFRKILLELLKARRDETGYVDEASADRDAVTIYKAGEKKLGTDDETFVNVFTSRSVVQLQALDRYYRKNRNKSVLDAIKSETSGDYKDALLALNKTRDAYFAERLHSALEGLGTNDNTLIYVLAVHDKYTLQAISRTYTTMFGHSLEHDIKGDTSGDYKALLTELLR